jgi:putative aldouronate transport system substrate-binding protein
LTPIGQEQINNSSNIPFAIYCPERFKVDSPVAPKAFNEEIQNRCQITYEYGRVNPWRIVSSKTWASEWPAYSQDYTAIRTKAVMGQISMDEYRNYVLSLRNDPIIRQAAEEFTASRNEFFPEGNLTLGR